MANSDLGALTTKAAQQTTEAAKDERVFTKFSSTRQATRMFTHKGIRISFVNHQFITDNEEIISYLRDEIKQGLRVIKEEGQYTSADLDPMVQLRNKFFAEFKAEQEAKEIAKLKGELPDMGSTVQGNLNASSSKNVAK